MKLIQALIAVTLLVSTTPLIAAQTKTVKRKPVPVSRKGVRHPRRKAVKPAPPELATITPSGLVYRITHHGEGRQPLDGERVTVHYTGLLTNGTVFDSSLNRGRPFVFVLGTGAVIKGWDEGIGRLHVGDQATFFIPPQLGYGEQGRGPIPPNATMIFVIELVGVEEKPAAN